MFGLLAVLVLNFESLWSRLMNSIVYIVGAVVIVIAILGFLGLR